MTTQTKTRTMFTRTEAAAKLTEMGYTLDAINGVYLAADGTMGGRLGWIPDYSNPDNASDGTAFYLRSPFGGPLTPVLGAIPAGLS